MALSILIIINRRYLKLCPLGVTCLLCRESLVTVTASISSSSGRARATRSGSVMISLYASSHSTDPARDSLEREEGVAAADTNCLQGDTGSSLIDDSWKLQLKSKSWKYGDSNLQRDSFIRINLNISIIIVFSGCGEGFITSRVHVCVSSELLSEIFLFLCYSELQLLHCQNITVQTVQYHTHTPGVQYRYQWLSE